MCLQDLRIGRRLTVREARFTGDGSGQRFPIDLTRAAMVVIDPTPGETYLDSSAVGGDGSQIIRDRELSNSNGGYYVYTRESMGGAANMPAWVYTEVTGEAVVRVHEYDADTMHEIYGPLKG